MSTTTNQTIAHKILDQLGGNKFRMMTGAKDLVAGENSLTIRIGRNPGKVTHVRVTLTAMDTYDMEFLRIRNHGMEIRTVEAAEGLYADNLCAAFESTTGLRTRLF